MASQSLFHPPFPDATVVCPRVEGVTAPPDATARLDESDDGLNPARGVLFGLALSAPFWLGFYWLIQSVS